MGIHLFARPQPQRRARRRLSQPPERWPARPHDGGLLGSDRGPLLRRSRRQLPARELARRDAGRCLYRHRPAFAPPRVRHPHHGRLPDRLRRLPSRQSSRRCADFARLRHRGADRGGNRSVLLHDHRHDRGRPGLLGGARDQGGLCPGAGRTRGGHRARRGRALRGRDAGSRPARPRRPAQRLGQCHAAQQRLLAACCHADLGNRRQPAGAVQRVEDHRTPPVPRADPADLLRSRKQPPVHR